MLALAVGLTLQASPSTADEWLAQMEATLRDASSLRIEAGVTLEWGQITEILWESKGADRLRVECVGWPLHGQDDPYFVLIADGETIAWRQTDPRPRIGSILRDEAGEPGVVRTPQGEGLVARAQSLLARSGIATTVAALRGPAADVQTHGAALCGERRISLRPATGVCVEVVRVPAVVGLSSADHTVWIDQERLAPLRRTIRYRVLYPRITCVGTGTIEETYVSVATNAEIPDERFQIPPGW